MGGLDAESGELAPPLVLEEGNLESLSAGKASRSRFHCPDELLMFSDAPYAPRAFIKQSMKSVIGYTLSNL